MNERDDARLFEELLSGKRAPGPDIPEEVLSAFQMARRLEASNPSAASRTAQADLGRLMARRPVRSRWAPRPSLGWALQSLAAFLVLAAVGLLFSHLLTVALRPTPAAPMVAMAPTAQPTRPAASAPESTTAPAIAQPAIPGASPTSVTSNPAEQQPTSEPIVVSMDQAVEQLPFPVLAPQDNSTPLQLESVQIPAEQDQSNTVIQTYNSPQGKVTIIQSEVTSTPAVEEPTAAPSATVAAPAQSEATATPTTEAPTEANTPTETAPTEAPTATQTETGATVSVRGQPATLTATGSGENALSWTENNTAITISGELPQAQLVQLANNLKPQEQPSEPVTIDCAATFPGLPGCLTQKPLASGRLVFVDPRPAFNNRPYLADLQTGDGWPAGEAPGQPVSFSPSGRYLLAQSSKGAWLVFDAKGKRVLKLADNALFDPFWLPQDALSPKGDWLAATGKDGGLDAYDLLSGKAAHVLPAGTFISGTSQPVVSSDGWIAWAQNPAAFQASGANAQALTAVPLSHPKDARSLALSADIQKDGAYRLLDWAPGTRTLLLGLWQGSAAEAAGLPLASFNVDTGQLTRLPATMLVTPEAYDWNPVKPGLMALAEGGGASIASNKRLALLNVNTGAISYLTLNDQSEPSNNFVAFQPKWSPDGRSVAFAGLQIQAGTNLSAGNALTGRGIWIVDTTAAAPAPWAATGPQTGEDGKWIDGWPQWSADGTKLLYTRQQDGKTDVRVHDLQTDKDNLLLTGLPIPACIDGGCNWSSMLLYTPKAAPAAAKEPSATPTTTLTPTPAASLAATTTAPADWAISAQLQPPEGSQELQQAWAANDLFGMWLKTFTDAENPNVSAAQRLDNFKISGVTVQPAPTSTPAESGMSFFAQVTFTVHPVASEGSTWSANTAASPDGWVNGLQRTIGVQKDGDVYRLYILP